MFSGFLSGYLKFVGQVAMEDLGMFDLCSIVWLINEPPSQSVLVLAKILASFGKSKTCFYLTF